MTHPLQEILYTLKSVGVYLISLKEHVDVGDSFGQSLISASRAYIDEIIKHVEGYKMTHEEKLCLEISRLTALVKRWEYSHNELKAEVDLRLRIYELETFIESRGYKVPKDIKND